MGRGAVRLRVDQTLTQWWRDQPASRPFSGGDLSRPSFGQVFDAQIRRIGREELDESFERIEEAAAVLSERMRLEDLQRYKEALKEFLERAMRLGLIVREETGRDRRGRPQLLKLLAILDERVLEIADVLREAEKDRIRLLALIGEIRGLLIQATA